MFDKIEEILFPNRCEVLKLDASQQFVFPIFKNGSVSLSYLGKILANDEITTITEPITVFLRDPQERFLSGVNTYVQHLERDHPGLDLHTVLFFVNQVGFLNRHYCPQFFWLINLARYTNPNTRLHFEHISAISELADINSKSGITAPSVEFLEKFNSFSWKHQELYFFMDQLLLARIGQSCTFRELMEDIKHNRPELYDLIFTKSKQLVNVLP